MFTFKFDERLIRVAEKKSQEMGKLKNSITDGDGSPAGFIGEFAAQKAYGGRIENTYHYDLILPDGRKVDVKTKRTTVEPKPHYDCSVASYNTTQKCDEYIFTRVDMEKRIVYVLGRYNKEQYFKEARLLKKGQKDGDNGFIVKADCYNIEIEKLSH